MSEPVTIRRKDDGPVAVVAADLNTGNVFIGEFLFDRRELEAALIVATGQLCSSSSGVLYGGGWSIDWPERLLAERYPPPEQWETVPAAVVHIGDTVRGASSLGEAFEVYERRTRLHKISFYSAKVTAHGVWFPLSDGTVERLVKPCSVKP